MNSIVVGEPVVTFLRQAAAAAPIRDADGKVLGFYENATRPEAPSPDRNGYAHGKWDLTANAPVLAVLQKISSHVELRDEAGKVVGHYMPVPPEQAQFVAEAFPPSDPTQAETDPLDEYRREFDLAEVEGLLASHEKGKGNTLAEVWESILSITPAPEGRAYLQEFIAQLKERDGCPTP